VRDNGAHGGACQRTRAKACATAGAEGIRSYREIRPDIPLRDLRLPDLSGIDVTLALRSEFPDARIILPTMFAGGVEIQRALEAGAQGFGQSRQGHDGFRNAISLPSPHTTTPRGGRWPMPALLSADAPKRRSSSGR
jgi:DNA-binding NarL/FixJ family response regulator